MKCQATLNATMTVAILLAVTASSAKEQDVVTPSTFRVGYDTVDARRVVSYDNAFVVTQLFKDGHVVHPGIWTDQLRLREVAGRKLFVRTQSLAYYDGRFLSSVNVFDPVTFAPVSDTQHNPDGSSEQWTFDANRAIGHLTSGPGASVETQTFDFGMHFYDFNCCMRSILPAMIPLRASYSATLSAFEGTNVLSEVTFKVLGREKVRAGARGMVQAWIVETSIQGGYVRFWINDQPPYLVRMKLSPNNVNAYAQSFDMLSGYAVVNAPPM